jgi:hypothetical protein
MNHKGTRLERKREEFFPTNLTSIYHLPPASNCYACTSPFFSPRSFEKTLINFVPFITHDLGIKNNFHKKTEKVNCFLSKEARVKKKSEGEKLFYIRTQLKYQEMENEKMINYKYGEKIL